jgi:hypothetical protein
MLEIKFDKQSEKIDGRATMKVVIASISTKPSNKDNSRLLMSIVLMLEDGTTKTKSGLLFDENLKVGNAIITQTFWNSKSSFGEGTSTKINNL